jgi:membrane fusion protein
LFRQEVLAQRASHGLGSIRIARPLSFSWVTAAALVFGALTLGFITWGDITRKATVPGVLLPVGGLLTVTAPQAGTVAEWLVRDGSTVRRGQPLLRLTSERHTAGGDVALLARTAHAQRLASLESERRLLLQQHQQKRDTLAQRERALEQSLHDSLQEAEMAERRAALALASLARFRELAALQMVAPLQLQQHEDAHLDLSARAAAARRQLAAHRQERAAIGAERRSNETQLQTALEHIDRARAAAEQERVELEARAEAVVVAPADGRVAALLPSRGQAVQPGQNLASIVALAGDGDAAASGLEAVLFAPSRTAGFIQPGQRVRIRYAAYPFQKFGMAGGVVVQIGEAPVGAQDLPAGQAQAILAAAQSAEPLRRITVRLDRQSVVAHGQTLPLTTGHALEADVALDTRKVWEWLFEPLLAARQRTNGFQ